MNFKFSQFRLLSAMLLLLGCAARAVHAEGNTDGLPQAKQSGENAAVLARAEALLEVLRKQLDDPQAAIKRGELEPYFDFSALTQAPISAHAKSFSKKQRAQLEHIFAQLVRQLAYASGAQFKAGESRLMPTVRPGEGQSALTDIKIKQVDDDVDNEVTFAWHKAAGGWRVIDVFLDGASVEKDYENQFAKIIARDGAQGLIKKMQTRLGEAQNKARAQKEGNKP